MNRCFVLLTLALAVPTTAAQTPPSMNWYKGNLHTHTINSDGDSPPNEVVAWYKRNGYQFLAITDHNTFTDPAPFNTNPADNFLLIGAEEVGLLDAGAGEKGVHVNAIGIDQVVPPPRAPTVTGILQASIDAIRAHGAVPLINHPNFRWAFTAVEMLPIKGPFLLEIASGHPSVNHAGDGQIPSTEHMWDQLLSAGMRTFGVSVDDVHNFRQEFTIDRSNPGRGWVVVQAPSLTPENILAALNNGDFYASSGVNLRNVVRTSDSLIVEVDSGARGGVTASKLPSPEIRYRVVFIGSSGRVLAVSSENPAKYTFAGNEGYVRARVEDSGGRRAWTQPVFVAAKR